MQHTIESNAGSTTQGALVHLLVDTTLHGEAFELGTWLDTLTVQCAERQPLMFTTLREWLTDTETLTC